MGAIDTVILFAYLALMVALGLYAQRRKPDVDDYFVAGRRMGPVTIACMWVAAWIGGAAIVGTSARVYEQGITGIWYVLGMAIGCALFGFTVARRVKKVGDGVKVVADAREVIANPDIDIVIELIGGYGIAKALVMEAISAGKHVITAN